MYLGIIDEAGYRFDKNINLISPILINPISEVK
jgi:hypothetical protein